MSPTSFTLVRLGPVINRWKYLVGAAVVLAAVISIVVALMLPNVYKSTAVFFPTVPSSTDPDRLLEGSDGTRSRLEVAARAEDLDRAITIGESQPVAEQLIKKYRLYRHYKAGKPGDDAADNAVLNEFSGNLTIVHNERDAIELSFADEDKKLAAQIANDVVAAIDSVSQQLTLNNRRKVLSLYRQRYDSISLRFERSRRQLVAARHRYGIFGLEQQGRYMSKEIVETQAALLRAGEGNAAGLRRALNGLTRADGGSLMSLENYVEGIDSVEFLIARNQDLRSRLVGARSTYEAATLSLNGHVSSLYVVQPAYPATKKFKPVRGLIVLSSVLFTFVLAVVVVALLELFGRRPPLAAQG